MGGLFVCSVPIFHNVDVQMVLGPLHTVLLEGVPQVLP